MARLLEILIMLDRDHHSFLLTYHPLALLNINLVSKHDLISASVRFLLSSLGPLTNGKLGGSLGEAWIRNSSLQLSSASKLLALFTS